MKKKGDLILIGIIFMVVVFSFIGIYFWQKANSNKLVAVISQDNKVVERIDLNKVEQPRIIKLSGNYHNSIRVEKGRIRYEDSDCPNLVCVNTGWLTKYGDLAVCLPNKMIIDIENK
ncbi:NusG domain II-containing protein [Desulfitobacterium sp. Sab5]|uniref:NusG domain II-containing protein n=1 Tax=Desulfitobacterium nosdiversum TaxID=3375356 RepID=UPI003CEE2541